ncbi:tetracycline resistance [Fusarium acutatum]|uniref:Tetracycline resistance n=1 Tax=Fusarium acutatum TaxID=78861 RepID=A0A8H4K585_9HYPO|nr:tetracycline resistance [Fusarium acutatum]
MRSWKTGFKHPVTDDPDIEGHLYEYEGSRYAFPSAILPRNKSDPWCPLVKPYGDMFCMDASNLESFPERSLDMMLLAPFFRTNKFTVIGDWNIAFKFDDSWINNFPSTWLDLAQEEISLRRWLAWTLFYEENAVNARPSCRDLLTKVFESDNEDGVDSDDRGAEENDGGDTSQGVGE